jgi:hypothetical protein
LPRCSGSRGDRATHTRLERRKGRSGDRPAGRHRQSPGGRAETPDEFGKLLERFDDFAGRDVVVVYRSDTPFSSAKAPPPGNDGQWLTLKSLAGAGNLTLDSGLIEGGSIRLDAGRAVTLVASSALKLWLLVGRF